MSHAIASESPAPAAGPRTIAIVGLGISCSQRDVSMRGAQRLGLLLHGLAAQLVALGHGLDVAARAEARDRPR